MRAFAVLSLVAAATFYATMVRGGPLGGSKPAEFVKPDITAGKFPGSIGPEFKKAAGNGTIKQGAGASGESGCAARSGSGGKPNVAGGVKIKPR
ncbi:MAG: hypothetical protein K2R98_14850 [Gemmataceae bacterium]|nr:hypothetical protein [Gemmataceae bacterium]